MAAIQLLPVKTASIENSIWRDITRLTFCQSVAQLKEATEIPGQKKENSKSSLCDNALNGRYKLPFETEKTFVNHFAFLAATEKSAARVTAVSLEEKANGEGLTVRLASNERILPTVEIALRAILDSITTFAERSMYEAVRDGSLNIRSLSGRYPD